MAGVWWRLETSRTVTFTTECHSRNDLVTPLIFMKNVKKFAPASWFSFLVPFYGQLHCLLKANPKLRGCICTVEDDVRRTHTTFLVDVMIGTGEWAELAATQEHMEQYRANKTIN